jgi:hypothetical protein
LRKEHGIAARKKPAPDIDQLLLKRPGGTPQRAVAFVDPAPGLASAAATADMAHGLEAASVTAPGQPGEPT